MPLETVATGLQSPEGPIAMADGSVLAVEIRRQTLSRVSPDGVITVVAHLGGTPSGAAISPGGRVYVCNNGDLGWVDPDGLMDPHGTASDYAGGLIHAVDLTTGAVETLYTECDGRPLRAPNDIVFDSLGDQANDDVCVVTGINGGITVISPTSEANHVPAPDFITANICFAGTDIKDFWLTGSSTGTLFRTRWAEPGLELAYNA